MMEYVIMCAIVGICLYIFSMYSVKQKYNITNDETYVEGLKNHKKGKSKGKSQPAVDSSTESEGPIRPVTSTKKSSKGNTQTRAPDIPNGVGAAVPIYIQNLNARSASIGEELDVATYGQNYLEVIQHMTELMYRKAMVSCLQYTDDTQYEAIQDVNLYISTIDNLRKLSVWVKSSYEESDDSGGNTLYGGVNMANNWFG